MATRAARVSMDEKPGRTTGPCRCVLIVVYERTLLRKYSGRYTGTGVEVLSKSGGTIAIKIQ